MIQKGKSYLFRDARYPAYEGVEGVVVAVEGNWVVVRTENWEIEEVEDGNRLQPVPVDVRVRWTAGVGAE